MQTRFIRFTTNESVLITAARRRVWFCYVCKWRNSSRIHARYIGISWALFLRKPIDSSITSFFLSLTLDIVHPTMLTPNRYLILLQSMIRCCITSSDLDIQIGELFPSFDAEPNNLFPVSESPGQTDTRLFSEVGVIQSIDQCRYNSNQKSRKMRFKREEAEACKFYQPFRDNGRSGTEAPSHLPQIVPVAGDNPALKILSGKLTQTITSVHPRRVIRFALTRVPFLLLLTPFSFTMSLGCNLSIAALVRISSI